MNENKKLNIIKVPNEIEDDTTNVKPFPRMPRMYLELLENKDKIKPDLLNRDYDPNDAESVISFYSSKEETQNVQKNMETIEEQSEKDDIDSEISIEESINSSKITNEEESELSVSRSGSEGSNDGNESIDSEMRPPSERIVEEKDVEENSEHSFLSEKNEKKTMLKQMLREETEKRPSPPRLSDLQREGMLKSNRVIPNLDLLEEESPEDEEDKKRELLFKFELLKKSYKNVDIPEFSIHSSLKKMNETYENQLRHLTLDSSVENYKNILVGGFMVFEFIFGVWLKFDMSGFTQQQILNMNQYERLLIELGQKSYVHK